MKRHAEAFTLNPPNLEQTFELPSKAGMTREEVKESFDWNNLLNHAE